MERGGGIINGVKKGRGRNNRREKMRQDGDGGGS